MTPEFDPVPYFILGCLMLWGIIAGIVRIATSCTIRQGFNKCCKHSVFFNHLDEHGRHGRSMWLQGRAYRCCWCGKLSSNFSIREFDPKSTPIFNTEREAEDAAKTLGD